ncbi:FxsB family cyclophane-forming radical SAM/SPASM peptide maturase [Longispora sp. NPDC051575]|uniref:FxsB family cyclophane-forming radical SAM/SPASM peptide maturase n=1 Tax=Longispora sp. NPDC051575 TaxID=3154943 RepID=UPI00342D420E
MPLSTEWPEHLDVAALEAGGWRPTPFQQFVVKVHSRCNLACDYCYIYELGDSTWRSKPTVMAPEIIDRTCARIGEHARAHGLGAVRVVLHGGEPLLAGAATLARTATALRAALPPATTLALSVQTNGVLLTDALLDTLATHGYTVGLSLDGDQEAHDRHRRYANGRGSHRAVVAALDLLAARPGMFAGLLCTVDLENAPVATYEALLAFRPPAMDLLLPHGTWSSPPPRRPADGSAPYADWLIAVFDRWYDAPRWETDIRLFDEIIRLVCGRPSRTEVVGLSPSGVVVVDTDGAVEQVDTLKAAYHGAPDTGLSVFDHPFDAALRHPAMVARQIGLAALSPTCMRCPVRDVCGGGCYPHRYRAGSGFRNPSVYCADMRRLIDHITGRLRADLRALTRLP